MEFELKEYPADPFDHSGDYGDGLTPYSVKELFMIQLSSDIRSKPNWEDKMKIDEIVNKWRDEMAAFFQRELGEMSTDAIDYVLRELNKYAKLKEKYKPMEIALLETMWKSDTLIDDKLKRKLKYHLTKRLETEQPPDWHPSVSEEDVEDEKKQVLDLVHPSLFPVVFGRTLNLSMERVKDLEGDARFLLEFIGGGEVINKPAFRESEYLSQKFQWLPAEFLVNQDGETTILSYINNLHPIRYSDGYSTLAKIFSKFVPLFERILTDLRWNKHEHRRVRVGDWYNQDEEDEDDFDYENRQVHQPIAPEFDSDLELAKEAERASVSLRNQTLKVIVKMANIHLTPESPDYEGGSWHVEGMENEAILATGIYYYDIQNITESRLKFRAAVCEPEYEQNDDRGVEAVYRLANDEPLNQFLGDIKIHEDLCIAFPNIYQHQVAPFSLQDPSQPGHRKILVFFLVDPNKAEKVYSSRTVPPQNSTWLVRELRNVGFMKLLSDVELNLISDYLQWPMSWDEALECRIELMIERSMAVDTQNEYIFEREFSLCEH
jgi:hypothetical protein